MIIWIGNMPLIKVTQLKPADGQMGGLMPEANKEADAWLTCNLGGLF